MVHYVGGKPWQSVEELTVLDYEEDGSGAVERKYGVLFEAWRYNTKLQPKSIYILFFFSFDFLVKNWRRLMAGASLLLHPSPVTKDGTPPNQCPR